MSVGQWNQRFFSSTRGQVVSLLRRGPATVDELAVALELTDNAVRAHLAALERDGLAHQLGLRRGTGKPSFVYGLTASAERLFPKSDGPLLRNLLDELADRLPPELVDRLIREAAHRAAKGHAAPQGTLRERVLHSIGLLGEMGGLAELEETGNAYVIRGMSCPLAAAADGHPAVCQLAAAFVSEIVGAPVCERCVQSGSGLPPHCRFEIAMLNGDGTID